MHNAVEFSLVDCPLSEVTTHRLSPNRFTYDAIPLGTCLVLLSMFFEHEFASSCRHPDTDGDMLPHVKKNGTVENCYNVM